MNKKAAQKLLSVWWFFVLAVVTGSIVIGVLMYYSADIDIRKVEADILAEKLLRCIVEQGYLREDFSQELNIFEKCGLREQLFGKGSNFYFKISVYDENRNLVKINEPMIKGDTSFEKNCPIEEKIVAQHFPRCVEKKVAFLYKENNGIKKGKIEILAGSNQLGKKVPLV